MCTIVPTPRGFRRSLGFHQPAREIDMPSERINFRILGACAAAAALLVATSGKATELAPLAPAQQAGTVNYRSGGVGSDSADAMKAEASRYSLSMTFTGGGNSVTYTIPTHLGIVNASGRSVLDITPDGPLVLVDLPAGKYRVTAAGASASKTESVEILAGVHKKLAFQM
jgi:hypothetical protein